MPVEAKKEECQLREAQVKELSRLQRFYWAEAKRCESAKAHLAGCVMLGSAVECLLLLFADIYFDEALAGRCQSRGMRDAATKQPPATTVESTIIVIARGLGSVNFPAARDHSSMIKPNVPTYICTSR
jgi:hypothetical protein